MNVRNWLCSLLPSLFLAAGVPMATAQSPAGAPGPAADPKQFMRMAAAATSLVEPDMKPWHLRAKYQQTGPDGAVKHEGVFEIWWVAPDQYKTSYTSAEFTQTEYRQGANTYTTGQVGWPPVLERSISQLLLHPLPEPSKLEKEIKEKEMAVGGAKLRCYTVKANTVATANYCFDGSLPALQLEAASPFSVTAFQQIVQLNGHYLARKIRSQQVEKRAINIDVDQADSNPDVAQKDLAPPADARPSPTHGFFLNPSQPKVVSFVDPQLSGTPRAADGLGTTIVKIIVTEAGTVEDPYAVGGPPTLQKAAVEAVGKYQLQPAMLSGLPIAVEISIEVKHSQY